MAVGISIMVLEFYILGYSGVHFRARSLLCNPTAKQCFQAMAGRLASVQRAALDWMFLPENQMVSENCNQIWQAGCLFLGLRISCAYCYFGHLTHGTPFFKQGQVENIIILYFLQNAIRKHCFCWALSSGTHCAPSIKALLITIWVLQSRKHFTWNCVTQNCVAYHETQLCVTCFFKCVVNCHYIHKCDKKLAQNMLNFRYNMACKLLYRRAVGF